MLRPSLPSEGGNAYTSNFELNRRLSCETNTWRKRAAFERSSKRRKGYPSETNVKRGRQVVHGEKELVEKLGRNDLCPCGSGRRFQTLLSPNRALWRRQPQLLFSGSSHQKGCTLPFRKGAAITKNRRTL